MRHLCYLFIVTVFCLNSAGLAEPIKSIVEDNSVSVDSTPSKLANDMGWNCAINVGCVYNGKDKDVRGRTPFLCCVRLFADGKDGPNYFEGEDLQLKIDDEKPITITVASIHKDGNAKMAYCQLTVEQLRKLLNHRTLTITTAGGVTLRGLEELRTEMAAMAQVLELPKE